MGRSTQTGDVRLLHGDCLEEMKNIQDGSVDLTVTSPPYDNLRTYNGSLEWGEHVWMAVIEHLYRVTANGGIVVWVVADATIKGSETGTSFRQALYFKECGFNLHDTMIYQTHKPPMNSNRYQACFEYMFVLSKGRPSVFNPIMVKCKHAGKKRSKCTFYKKDGTLKMLWKPGVYNETKIKDSIWVFSSGNGRVGHPAVFPIKLASDHILSWSNPGDIILDPFMGSGTTGVACVNLNRTFIGIEKVDGYFEIAKNRIEKVETEKEGE